MSGYAEKYEKWKKKRDKESEDGLKYGVKETQEPQAEASVSYGAKVAAYRAKKNGTESNIPESQVYRTQGNPETYKKFVEYREAVETERKRKEENKTPKVYKPSNYENRPISYAAELQLHPEKLNDENTIIKNVEAGRRLRAEKREKRENEYSNLIKAASELVNNEDFEEKSKYSKSTKWLPDIDYEYVNNPEMAKAALTDNGGVTPQTRKGYDYVNEEERAIYNYIYNTEGKKKAKEYLEALNLEERMAEDTIAWNEEYAEKHPVKSSITSVLSNLANAGQGYVEGINAYNTGEGIDINSYGNVQRRASNKIRETVAAGINSEAGAFLYQTGMSIADSITAQVAAAGLAMLGLPPVVGASAILASNAATDGMISAKERGASDDQALLTGLAQGGAEWFFEKVSLGNLEALKETAPATFKELVKGVLKQGGIEGSEEVFTSIANEITDQIINKDLSELNLMKQYYISQGMSEEEAEKQVKKDFAKQIGMDFLGGFVSGTTMSTAVSTFNYALNKKDEKAGTLPEETETLPEETETLPKESETISEESEMIPEEIEMEETEQIPWEEAQMYAGEPIGNASEKGVAPAQKIEENQGILKGTEPKSEGEKIIDTVLENGNVSDNFADEIVKNDNLRKAFEAKTGITIRGNETEQRNTVKAVARSYAESHTGTVEQKKTAQNASVAAPARQNATIKGKGVEIVGVETENGSELKFKDSSGNSYTTSEVKFADGVAQKLYGAAAEIAMVSDSETANSFVQHYEASMPIQYYAIGFDRFYSLGKMGVPKATALKSLDFLVSNTSEEAMMNAWNLGNRSRENDRAKVEVKKEKQKRKGTGTYEDQTRNFNANAQLQTLVANRTGIDIKREAGTDENTNGYFIPSMMQMVISDKAANEYATLLHELGEFGLAYNKSDMKELQNMLLRYQAEQSGIKGVGETAALIKAYQRLYAEKEGSKTYEQAVDEMVNDALAGLFSSDEGVDQFVEWLQKDSGYSKAEQKSLVQQLMDLLDHIVKYLKTLVKEGRQSAAALKAAELEAARVEELRTKFLEVLEGAIETAHTTGEYEIDSEMKFSLFDFEKDTEGNKLTKEQQEYFANSQIRDNDGALKVMYHGTPNNFTVFNPFLEGGKNGTQEGYGIYFTDAKDVAEAYGDKRLTGYVNITHPATTFEKNIKKSELVKLIKATIEAEAYQYVEDGDYDTVKEAIRDTWISNYVDTYSTTINKAISEVASEILFNNDNDMEIVMEVMNGMAIRDYESAYEFYDILKKTIGIDGFVTEWEKEGIETGKTQIAVAFDSNQFKNVGNQNPTESPDIRHSFAGVDAVTANKSMLELANEMEQRGEDSETIRKHTGWHRGYDRKWRFEIDDSQMEITGDISNYMKLDQLVKHDKLFEAYPILRETHVIFQNIEGNGSFDRQFFCINLNSKLKNDPEQLKKTLIHEIQHAIQHEEGFANGSNSKYWESQLENGYDSRPKEVQRKAWKLRRQYLDLKEAEPEFVSEMEKLHEMVPNVPRGAINWDTLEPLEEDPVEWQIYDAERERLEDKYGEERVFDFIDLGHRMKRVETEGRRSGSELYLDTAGEIEARETSERLTFDEADRRRYQPRNKQENLKRDNVVFANARSSASEIEVRELDDSDYEKLKSHFGTTANFNLAGYMLKDGTMLDFSGKHWGDTYSTMRQVDHRDIEEAFEDATDGTEEMINMISNGNIRMMSESGGINLSQKPTVKQKRVLEKYIEFCKGEVIVDIDEYGGDTVKSFSYSKGTSPQIIIKDIDNYFRGGNQSDLMRFHTMYDIDRRYSLDIDIDAEVDYFGVAEKLNDYIGVQKAVLETLPDNFYQDIVNKETGMKISIGRKGIKETLSSGKRFQTLPKKLKKLKIATLRSLPELLEKSVLTTADASNIHDESPRFSYLETEVKINGENYRITFDVKKTSAKNHFWMHCVRINEKNSALLTSAPEGQKIHETQSSSDGRITNEENDVKYSIETEDLEELQRQHENTLRENDIFRHMIDYLTRSIEATKGTAISEKSAEGVANRMIRRYKSEADKGKFAAEVQKLFKMMSEGKANKEDFLYFAEETIRPVVEQSKNNKQISDYAKGILSDIRKTPIKLGKLAKQEVAYHYGSYNDFRRKLFGRAQISNNGTELDILWQQWSGIYPELFDAETVAEDQPVRLAEIIDALKEDYDSEVGYNLEEAVTYAAMELMEEYAKLPEVKALTAAQDMAQMQRNIRKLNEEYRQQYEQKLRELKGEHREKLARQEAKFRARMSQSRSSRLETQERKKYKDSIVKNTKEIMRWLEVNNDKYHVPEVLRETTIGFLGGMDFTTENGWNSQDTVMLQNRLNILYRKLSAESTKAEGDDVMADLDPDFLPTLDGLISLLEQSDEIKKIGDMDSLQLRDVAYLVGTLKRVITTANRLIANKQYQHVSQIGDSTVSFLARLKAKKQQGKWATMGDELLNLHMLDSRSFFEEMGEAAESLWQELRDGFNQRTWKLERAKKYMEEVVGDSKIAKWTGKKAETHSFEFNGQQFDITTGQLMTLYLLSKRPQAYNHLMAGATMYSETGGFTIEAQSVVKGQKIPERRIKVTDAQMQEMFKSLTPEQIRIAKAMQKFLAKDCAEWGNEVSMTMYGYKKFGEATYWPIKTNDNFNKTDDKNAETGAANTSLYAIRNQGMTKNLVKNASNPIVVGDVFEVFAEHVANMANYNAFVIPLSDAMKWFNYRSRSEEGAVTGSIKEEMERSYGKGAKRYFINFIKDINGEVKKGVASEISSTFTSKYKAAAVGANLRVVIQQPTAIFRAMSVMNPRYLAQGIVHGSAIKEMHENSAISVWKSWGYFETGLGQSMKQVITGESTALEKTVEVSMKGAGIADDVTWGVIWNAVKAEVKEKNKDIDPSSEEYMNLVRKRFDEVIDQTQVVDTILHRSQIMRSGDGVVKMATAFMAEPTKSYNLLHNAIREVNQNNNAENRIKVARRAVVYGFTAIMTAAAASILDAFRDDDEEKEWVEKWIENWKANAIESINPISQIPYLKELSSLWQGFDSSRMDMAGVSTLVNAVQQAYKYINGESKKTLYGVTKGIIRGMSQVTGIPLYNALRDVESTIEQFTFAPFDEEQLTGKDVRIRLIRAMREGNEKQIQKYLSWYDEQYRQKIEDGKTDKEAKASLKSSITSQWKSIYQNSTTAEKIEIKKMLLKIRVNNQQLYKGYDWSSWDEK